MRRLGLVEPSGILHADLMRCWFFITWLLVGCAGGTSSPSLGPVALYRVSEDGVSLKRIHAIELPNRADVIVRPQWFSGALRTPPEAADDVRIQTQMRLHRADGVAQHFFVTGDNSDRTGHTERVSKPTPAGRYSHSMAGRRYGPIDAFESVALELYVAQVEPGSGGGNETIGGPVGVMALRQAPPLDCMDPALLSKAEKGLEPYGATLELAARIPIRSNVPTSDRVYAMRLIAVEAEPDGTTEEALERVVRIVPSSTPGSPPLADRSGRLVEGLTALSFVLQVGEHVQKSPPKEKPRKPKDERLRSPQKVSQK